MDLLIELKIISYLKINAANPLRDLYININIVHIYCTLIIHFYIDFNNLNNNRRHIVEVIWKTNNIIYSTKFRPQIRIKNSNPRDVSLINIKEIDDKKTKAILYYIIPNNVNKDDTLTIGTCFELYDGPCFIGTGTVIEYWEER